MHRSTTVGGATGRRRVRVRSARPRGIDDAIGRTIGAVAAMRRGRAVALIAWTIAFGWLWVYLAGGVSHVPPHWFYVPILLAATRFGIGGAVVTAACAGLVAGPLMPADVGSGTAQLPSDQIVRALWFVVIGGLMGAIVRRLERSLAQEAELARREVELAAHKAAVIATVSHEFRTPLAVLLGSSKMLLAGGASPEAERALLEGIASSSRRLSDLVTTVLVVSEGPLVAEELIRVETPLRRVVSNVVTGTDPGQAPRVRVEVGDLRIETAPAALETLLRQLVDNALKFSPPDASVEVRGRSLPDGRVELIVDDRGPGIDPGFLPSAFEPFTQQDEAHTRSAGGLGIGLFVALRLADHLGAELDLRPRDGGGTAAVVRL